MPAAALAAAPRREPMQQRSRDRLERILAVASRLIAENGSDLMRMSEVAQQADISIGSLYQYFPDKAAIVCALAERFNAQSRACIDAALADVRDSKSLMRAFSDLVDQYYALFLAEPVIRDVWSGTQADKQLAAIELATSRASGARLAEVLLRLHPKANRKQIAASALLVWQLGEATMRLAISVPREEGDALVDAYKRMCLSELSRF